MSFEYLSLFLIWLNFMLYNLIFNRLYWIAFKILDKPTTGSSQHKPPLAHRCKYMKSCLPLCYRFSIPWSQFCFTEKFKSTCSVLYPAKLIYFSHTTAVHSLSSKTNELFFIYKNVHLLLYENRIKILETEGNKDHIKSSSSQPSLALKEETLQILHRHFHKVDANFILIPKPKTTHAMFFFKF